MTAFFELMNFLWCCYRIYRATETAGYSSVESYGIPSVTVFVAKGREAWRVSQFASDYNFVGMRMRSK